MKKLQIFLLLFVFSLFVTAQNNTITIATFNIQNLGKSKLAKPLIVDTLVAIIHNFDIIAVQEISDISNQTANQFLNYINNNNQFNYKVVCSQRTGKQEDDKSSQEQYAFYYNADKLQLIDTALYDDSSQDYFQREPYIAAFKTKTGNTKFIICSIHTNPEKTVQEISALFEVGKWIPIRFGNYENIIFCGDFNASCSYASTNELDALAIRKPPYFWVIPDNVKTNISAKSNCAYDRFVVTEPIKTQVIEWNVFKYFKTKAVSDHYPVYIRLNIQ